MLLKRLVCALFLHNHAIAQTMEGNTVTGSPVADTNRNTASVKPVPLASPAPQTNVAVNPPTPKKQEEDDYLRPPVAPTEVLGPQTTFSMGITLIQICSSSEYAYINIRFIIEVIIMSVLAAAPLIYVHRIALTKNFQLIDSRREERLERDKRKNRRSAREEKVLDDAARDYYISENLKTLCPILFKPGVSLILSVPLMAAVNYFFTNINNAVRASWLSKARPTLEAMTRSTNMAANNDITTSTPAAYFRIIEQEDAEFAPRDHELWARVYVYYYVTALVFVATMKELEETAGTKVTFWLFGFLGGVYALLIWYNSRNRIFI